MTVATLALVLLVAFTTIGFVVIVARDLYPEWRDEQ
jgi:hypothetical protein